MRLYLYVYQLGIYMFSIIDRMYGRSVHLRNEHVKNNPRCAACGRKDGVEVHHIVPYHVDPSKLDRTNHITLCGKYCHLFLDI